MDLLGVVLLDVVLLDMGDECPLLRDLVLLIDIGKLRWTITNTYG
jgi:hypothetical protein